jgi:energy-coupling factor transport system permease protein
LRGRPTGLRGVRGTVMPVLEDALERSVRLAASMDVRGYGRTEAVPARTRRLASMMLLVGLAGLVVGSFAVLDGSAPFVLRLPMVAIGAAACVAGLALSGRRISRTVYRPDPWALPEWTVSACGVAAAATMGLADSGSVLDPPTRPLQWPTVTVLAMLPALFVVLPAWVSPPVPGIGPVGRRTGPAPVLEAA